MDATILTVLVMLVVALAVMMAEILRPDVAAWLLTLGFALLGILTPAEALSGFSRSAVVTILGTFILTNALYRTGVTQRIGATLYRLAGASSLRLMLIVVLGGGFLSLFMNNVAAAAVMMPATMDLARRTRTSPSKLLMPMAFGVTLGGMATLLTTANIIVSEILRDHGLQAFGLLDFAPVGLPIIFVGTTYILLLGRRLLPDVNPALQMALGAADDGQPRDLTETYLLEERLSEVIIGDDSPLVGQSVAESGVGQRLGISIVAICHSDRDVCLAPRSDEVIQAGDRLIITGRAERVNGLVASGVEVEEGAAWNNQLADSQVVLQEVTLAPRSAVAGRTLKELRFRERYDLSVVAIWREGRPYRTDVGDIPLQFGDGLLVHGAYDAVKLLQSDPDFLVLTESEEPVKIQKAGLAALIMIAALVAAATRVVPIAQAMMLGALATVVTGCQSMDDAYRSIEWRAIFLIAGMLSAGVAMTKSGAAAWMADLLSSSLAGWGPLVLAGGVFLLAMMLAQVMSGQVAGVVLAPIAIAAAQQMGADPRAMAMAAALGCSMVFVTPTGHAVNVFVMGPGGYRFRDFFRAGAPLTLLLFVAIMALLPIFWPFR